MPVYEHKCEYCDWTIEVQSKVLDRDKEVYMCPQCGEDGILSKMRRTTGYGGFSLKGSCWSRDNYATHVGDDPSWSERHGYGGKNYDE